MIRRRQLLLALSLAILMAGCGFQLREPPKLSFSSIYLGGSVDPVLAKNIKTALTRDAGLVVAPAPDKADVVVTLSPLFKDKQILTLNSQGLVSQFTLLSRLTFRASDRAGHELLPPTSITVTRLFNYSDAQILAKQQEEQLLNNDMQQELIQQMIRRLAALKPRPADAS
jgi:LPS-assembly lipoprotein